MSAFATKSPESLQSLCLSYIATKIVPPSASDGVGCCQKDTSDSVVLQKSFGSSSGVFVHSNVADVLLSLMSTCQTLSNQTLELFQSCNACLRHVVIRRSQVTAAGLRVLRSHRLITLVVEADYPKQFTISDIICCLNEWTVANLRSLSVAGVTFGQAGGPPVIVSLCALRNLRSLDVNGTDFTDSMLKIIVDDLPLVESLDISSTLVRDVTSLSQCRTRLRRLFMYNVRLNDSSSTDVLRSLSALRILDISHDAPKNPLMTYKMNTENAEGILQEGSEFHDLQSLDISGTPDIPASLVRYHIIIFLCDLYRILLSLHYVLLSYFDIKYPTSKDWLCFSVIN